MSELLAPGYFEARDDEANHHMLATLTPEQRDGSTRDTLVTLAGNFRTLAEELQEILEAAQRFNAPEIPIQWLTEAEQKFASGVRCIARSAGLVEK
jgi:hypothetical protein